MKLRLSLVILLPILLVGAGLFTTRCTARVSDALRQTCALAREAILEEDYPAAAAHIDVLQAEWASRCETLRLIINHPDIDEVTRMLKGLSACVQAREQSESLLHAALLDEALSHLSHRDAPTLSNIL